MSQNNSPLGNCCRLAALLILGFGAQDVVAATLPFTFEVTYDSFLNGVPTPSNLTVPAMNVGSGFYTPFGSAIYTETGTVTFAASSSGDLGPSTVSLNFTASFNGGADTFSGTDFHVFGVSETTTILSGTGIFSGATGTIIPTTVIGPPSGNTAPNYFGTLSTSGTGQITAPNLAAIPEPSTAALLGLVSVALLGFPVLRRRFEKS